MQFLNGKKTHIVGLLSILLGVGKILGFEVPGYESIDAGMLINSGLLAMTFRSALNQ